MWLHYLSAALEVVIVVLCLHQAFARHRYYALGFALTFALYVVYDLGTELKWGMTRNFLESLLLTATVSALLTILYLGRRRG